MKISYLGPPGSFSQQACLAVLPDDEHVAEQSFGDVAAAVIQRRSDRGILPLENSTSGPVPEVERILAELQLRIVSEHRLPVRLHLLGRPDALLDDIQVVVSHPVALAQCQAAIAQLGSRTEQSASSAAAARNLRNDAEAALASEAAADAYGLKILLRNVQDRSDNSTLFAVVARR